MQVQDGNQVDYAKASDTENKSKSGRRRRHWTAALVCLLLVTAAVIAGILPRVKARAQVHSETLQLAVPNVSVVHPQRSAAAQEIVLPANVQPYINSPIYARTNGYLRKWYTDIGAKVKKGQLLAEIETPELDAQLQQARANLATAQANLQLAKTTAERYQGLLKTNSVAKQDTDNAVGAYNAGQAIVASNLAEVRRLQELQSYERVYAPFNGVITARNTDIGALINAGSGGGPGTELFQIAQPNVLRVYTSVPEGYAPAAKVGLLADVTFAEYPGKNFVGKLVRTANAIDTSTRTLLVEIDVNNPTGQLFSGAYAQVHMKLPNQVSFFMLPVSTLLFRAEGLRVATVENGRVRLLPVTLGRDFGNTTEVISGLKGDESVINNPPDSLVTGEQVRVVPAGQEGGGL